LISHACRIEIVFVLRSVLKDVSREHDLSRRMPFWIADIVRLRCTGDPRRSRLLLLT